MLFPKKSIIALAGFLFALVITGCSTVRLKVPVTRPAEINLKGKEELVIGEVKGRGGEQVGSQLKEAAVSSGRFKLVDREHLNRVLSELSLSVSDLGDMESRKKLGKLLTGSILIMGNIERYQYDETTKSDKQTCTKTTKKKTTKYVCYVNYRMGEAQVTASFDVIDVETGENLKPKRVVCKQGTSTSATDKTPDEIDGQALLDQCAGEVVAGFMKAIAPWQDYVEAAFETDGDLPALERGVNYARAGQWNEAIESFESAVNQAASSAGMDAKTIAKAHWNLGLAYEYTSQFSQAEEEIKKAYEMSQNAAYLQEISNVQRLKREREALEAQTNNEPAS
jgi:hypothetical protein